MMTFKQFISEDEDKIIDPSQIKNDCSFFFQESEGKGLLLRGVGEPGNQIGLIEIGSSVYPVYRKRVRRDRKPLSTHIDIHREIDNWFDDKFDIKARSSTLFCVGAKGWSSTSKYGERYIIIPIDEFRYVWSWDIEDLFDDVITPKLSAHEAGPFKDKFNDAFGDFDRDKFTAEMNKLHYQTDGLEDAVRQGNEIMIACDEYYAIRCRTESSYTDLLKLLT